MRIGVFGIFTAERVRTVKECDNSTKGICLFMFRLFEKKHKNL